MGSNSGGASQDSRDDDDDEEYEEAGSGNRFLGFMFGNVDNSGDLDVDYLDEDAKEHLAALADKLGSSLTDIDLSVRSIQSPADAVEEDYDEKAEDAVDYEDIDEQYEGPEVQAVSEEENLLSKKEYLSAKVPVNMLQNSASIFDDENYDEEEENEEHGAIINRSLASHTALPEVQGASPTVVSEGEIITGHGSPIIENSDIELKGFQEIPEASEELLDGKSSAPLPVLYREDGVVILRFSEIFGIHELSKKKYKSEHVYLVQKERLKAMDSFDIEEDEEDFLRGSGQGFALMQHRHIAEDDIRRAADGDRKLEEYDVGQDNDKSCLTDDELKDGKFLDGGPMKEGSEADFSTVWQLPSSPNYYPLAQEDWEKNILWDTHPSSPDSPAKGGEISGTEVLGGGVSGLEVGTDLHGSPLRQNVDLMLNPSGVADALPLKTNFHPQLLRLESHLGIDKASQGDNIEESVMEEKQQDGTISKLSTFSWQNRNLLEGSWLDEIIWESNVPSARPKLILDLQDDQMLFEVLDDKDCSNFWLHARAMIIARPLELSSHEILGLPSQESNGGWRFDIANDIFYSNRKTSQQPNATSEKRTAFGIEVYHSAPALKLETMKLKLSNKDITNFHRPKALWYPHDNEVALKEQEKLPTQGPMKILIKSLGGKGSKLHVDAEETISSIKAKASKKLDFKPVEPVKIFYRGKELEDNKSLVAQSVRPNSLVHVVRTNVYLLPKAQKIPGENKSLRPPGAFKKKSELSVKDGHVFLMEYCEERPLLLSNTGMGAKLCTYYQKTSPSDQSFNILRTENRCLGTIVALDPADKSPFLGDIRAACTQSSLETNMYRAPVFSHNVPATDYLLVRSAKGKLSIRRIDKLNVVGQQEPLMEVMSPGTKDLQSYLMKRVLVYMFREFRALKKRGAVPFVRADELSAQFPNLSEVFLRNRLRKHACAELKRGPGGALIWKMRPNFHIPSEEALRKLVPPEKVCAYESMQAGLYRLKHLGITKLKHPAGISSATSQLPNEAIALAAASHIERELLITPWNLSSNFVACTNQVRENLERLEISGVGDPSGRGLGFSYVRAAPKAPVSSALTKKKAAAGRGGSTVTGTDADLRRLSMEAAREVLLKFNVPDEVIAKQTRWHRIAMIRELSSEQAASGVKVDPTTISKYARGQRMSFTQMQQQTREKCQEIWDRQIQSLSAIEGDEGASDLESNSDLDSFAGDLENLLDAEEFEGDEAVNESKNDRIDSVKGIKMRRHPSLAEAEEKVEDEAAEAAELCRMLMDDDEMQSIKKKKTGTQWKEARPVAGVQAIVGSENVDRAKKPKKVVKPIPSSIQIDRLSTPKETIGGDQKEQVETLTSKKNIVTQVNAKKVKIVGDGIKVFKEKKSARESFVCGACGQLGHMRTNKNCPKYGEDLEPHIDVADPDKTSGKYGSLDLSSHTQQKSVTKKVLSKSTKKNSLVEAPEGERSSSKTTAHPLKFKHGSAADVSSTSAQTSEQTTVSAVDPGNKSAVKVNKIVITNKTKPVETQIDHPKPSIVIRPPAADISRVQPETPKTAIVFKPPVGTDKLQIETRKPSIKIRPPAEIEKERTHKKIKIKRPKEIIDLDKVHQEVCTKFEHRKIKKIVELSDFEWHEKRESTLGSFSKKKAREDKKWWEEEERRRNTERMKEERKRRLHLEEEAMLDEREKLAEIERYEMSLRREREEEERQKAKKKKVRKFEPEEYEEYRIRRNDRRMTERNRTARRRPVLESPKFGLEYTPPTKRRKGGEVGLANILERIVDALRGRQEVSYLFLKPVPKKEAPDYLDIIDKPMDLSTIREKVRRLEYKSREDFRHDVWQITYNAHKYNDGRNPGIPPLADQLLELCDHLLVQYDGILTEAEEGIEN